LFIFFATEQNESFKIFLIIRGTSRHLRNRHFTSRSPERTKWARTYGTRIHVRIHRIWSLTV